MKCFLTPLTLALSIVLPLISLTSIESLEAQATNLDSLAQVAEQAVDDSIKLDLYYTIAYDYLYADREKAQFYSDKIYEIAKKSNNPTGIGNSYYLNLVIQQYDGNTQKVIELGEQTLDWAQKNNQTLLQANILNTMTMAAQTMNRLDDALAYIKRATAICEAEGAKNKLAVCYYTTASIYEYLDENKIAEGYLRKALPIFEELNDDYRVAVVYQALSTVTKGETSIDYAKKGLVGMQKTNDLQGQAMCYWTIGATLIEMEAYSQSLSYLDSAYQLFEKIDYTEGSANIEALLGIAKLRMGTVTGVNQLLDTALVKARKLEADDILALVYQGKTLYQSAIGQPAMAARYLDSLLIVKDTLYSREKSQFLLETEAQLRTQEKEAEIAQQALKIERVNRIRNAVLLGALLAIAILLTIFQFFRNQQQRKRQIAEMDLQLKNAEAAKLKELDHLKSAFFANISHEFRTPLTLILGPIKHALESIPASETLSPEEEIMLPARHLEVMERNAVRLDNLINQLLDLTKLESGKLELKVQQGPVIKFLRNLIFSFESLAERKRILFKTEFPGEIKTACFDPDKLEKIVINMLSNAFKFTPEMGTIGVYVKLHNGHLRIRISDTGKGIKTDDLDKIFNRFYQVEDTQDQGTGIGLALVKELVDLHRGNILVDSVEGLGTNFTLSIPIDPSYYTTSEIRSSPNEPKTNFAMNTILALEDQSTETTSSPPNFDQAIALVVEDNPDLRHFMEEILTPYYRVEVAQNGAEGLEKAIQKVPDIIVSDVMMPQMDGFELSKHLRENEKTNHIPIILLTAKAGQEHKVSGLETGVDDYLTKPFDQRELLVRMDNLIQQRQRLKAKFNNGLGLKMKELDLSSMDERFIKTVLQQVEENLGNEFYTVEELAKSIGFSRSQLHRKMRALLDKSPNELIRDLRLAHAKELLQQKTATVSEIAYQVGYSNLSYFSKSFKALYGKSPSEV